MTRRRLSAMRGGLSRVLAFVPIFLAAFGIGAAFAQPKAPALGKPGEPARIRVAIAPSYAGSWTGLVAYERKYQARGAACRCMDKDRLELTK